MAKGHYEETIVKKSILVRSTVISMSTICMLAAMSSSALAYDNRCAGMNKQLDQLSKAVDAACKATKAKDCKKINSDKSKEYQKVASDLGVHEELGAVSKYFGVASDFVKEWNKVVGNSSLKIGARYFTLGKGGNGTIQSTQRMWVSKGIATKDSVTIKVKELDGKLYVGAHVCVLEPGKSKPVYKKTVYFNKDKKEKGKKNQTKSIRVNGTKGKIVFFKISAQRASTNKFKYNFSSTK